MAGSGVLNFKNAISSKVKPGDDGSVSVSNRYVKRKFSVKCQLLQR